MHGRPALEQKERVIVKVSSQGVCVWQVGELFVARTRWAFRYPDLYSARYSAPLLPCCKAHLCTETIGHYCSQRRSGVSSVIFVHCTIFHMTNLGSINLGTKCNAFCDSPTDIFLHIISPYLAIKTLVVPLINLMYMIYLEERIAVCGRSLVYEAT